MSISKAVELRAERARLIEQAKAVLTRAEGESRNLNSEEQVEFDRIHAAADEIRARFERIETQDRIESELSESRGRVTEITSKSADEQNSDEQAYSRAFRSYLVRGENRMSSADREILETRAQSTTNAAGGFTIPAGFSGKLEEALKAYGGMRSVAQVIPTDSGNSIAWPTVDDTAQKGVILGENTGAAEQDVTFGSVTLGAFKYSSKMIKVSVELMQDSAFNLDEFLARSLGTRIARIVNEHCTTGTGAGQPNGAVTASTLGKTGAAGQVTSVTYADLVDLVHSIDPEYRRNASLMMKDSTVQALKKLVDTTGRPLWSAGIAVGAPDTLLSLPLVVNQDMPAMAASAKSILCGDFSKYVIRDVKGVSVLRLVERFADAHQVAFIGFSRHDGQLVSASTSALRHYANAAA